MSTERRRFRRSIKPLLKWGALALLLISGALVGINLYIWNSSQSYLVAVEQAPPAQAAIVLGAYVRPDGSLSFILQDRVERAVQLYHQKKVSKLLLTGDHGRVHYDEVNHMARYALSKGVPEGDLFLDHAGFSTYESMYRARDVFQVKRALVVTQGFHLPRAVYTARALGIEAWGVDSDLRSYRWEERYSVREIFARVKAFAQIHVLRSRPTFLGPVLPITGDGRVTQDRPLKTFPTVKPVK